MLEVLLSDRILRARDPASDQLVYRQVFDQVQVNYVLTVLLDLIRLERVGKGTHASSWWTAAAGSDQNVVRRWIDDRAASGPP